MASEFDDVLDQEAATAGQPLTSGLEKSAFADVLDAEVQQQQNYVRTVVDLATKDNPEAAAERARLSQATGLPPDVVARNQQELKRREIARAIDLQRMMRDSPVLFRQMNDPTFTGAAIDDLDTLKQIERTFGNVASYAKSGEMASDAAGGARSLALGATVGVGKMVFDLFGAATDLVGLDYLAGGYRTMSQNAAEAMDAFGMQVDTSTGQAIKSGLQSAGQNLALLPIGLERGLFKTAEAAGAAVAGAMSAGVGADSYMRARQQGADRLTSSLYGLSDGGVEFVMERIPASLLFKGIELDQSLLKTLGQQALSEGWTEQVTTIAQDFNEWMLLNPQKSTAEFLAERPEAAYQTLVATLVGTGVQTSAIAGINKLVERATDQSLTFEQDRLLRQMQLAASSALRERSPEMFRAYVERASTTEDGPKEIYIDAEVLNQLPAEVLAQLPEGVRAQIPDALDTNSSVAIPMADVLTFAPGSVLEQTLNDNARMRPDAPSRVEAEQAKQFIEQEAERVLQQAQDQSAWQSEVDTVRDTIKAQLDQAGRFTSDANEAYARLQSAFFSTMASRTGMTPTQLYEQFSLKVGAQAGQGAVLNAGAQFDRDTLAETDAMLEANQLDSVDSAYQYMIDDRSHGDEFLAAAAQILYPGEATGINVREWSAGVVALSNQMIADTDGDASELDIARYQAGSSALNQSAGRDVTQSPEFRAWGKDHQVVMVHHGSRSGGFLEFRRSQHDETALMGVAVSKTKDVALRYAFDGSRDFDGVAKNPTMYTLYVRSKEIPTILQFQKDLQRFYGKSLLQITQDEIDAYAQDRGISVVDTSAIGEKGELFVLLPDGNIKSATGNSGAFDGNDPNVFQQRGVQAKSKPVPGAIDTIANVEASFAFAGNEAFPTNRDFKLAVQARVAAASKAANVDLSEFTTGVEEYLVRMALADGQTALRTNANAVGWYNEKVTKALRLVSLIHPEVATDPQAKFAFVWAMAVTSNGLKVDKNFELAETVYRRFKETGSMPTDVGIGTAAAAINRSLGLYNTLVAKHGFEVVERFMTTMQTAGEVTKFTGQKVNGENKTTMVYGAAALGPKIGNGFFMNLYGRFEQLTMDRWLMRTWGRWTGTLVLANPAQVKAKRAQLKALIQSLTPADKKAFEAIIGRKMTVGDVDGVGLAIWKASQKPANRTRMSEIGMLDEAGLAKMVEIAGEPKKGTDRVTFGDELRKTGNALTKYIDGQKEAPAGPPERGAIRKVFNRALAELQKDHPALTMSDFQALLWYPEKRLYDAAKTADESSEAYEDDEAPDYANAAAKLARAQGVSDSDITAALTAVDAELQAAVSAGGVRPGERGPGDSGATAVGEVLEQGALDLPKSKFAVSARDASVPQVWYRGQIGAMAEQGPFDSTAQGRSPSFADSANVASTYAIDPNAAGLYGFANRPADAGEQGNVAPYRIHGPLFDIRGVQGAHGTQTGLTPQAVRSILKDLGVTDVDIYLDDKYTGKYGRGKSAYFDAAASDLPDSRKLLPAYVLFDDSAVQDALRERGYAGAVFNGALSSSGNFDETKPWDETVVHAELRAVQRGSLQSTLSGALNQGPRGTFNPQTLLIALGESADLSTFLHESGHFFLEVMADLASRPDAPQQVVDDMNRALAWFGVPDLATWNTYTLDQKREHHEKWAESFEQYLLEGKAPSTELQPLFRRFRSWLVNVYKSLSDFMRGRNLEVNDEIRQVFDRMLATDEQIAQAEEQAGLLPDFDATNEAIERLQERSLRALKWTLNARSKFLKQFTKEARELRKGVLAEVMGEFETKPEVIAARAIRKVRNKDGAERDAKIAAIADATGYPTVEEMTAAVTALGPVNEAVEAEVDRRMLERHGDMATQEALEAAANEAVHNEARARALAAELKSQNEAMNPRETTGRTDARGRPITVNALVEAARAFGADLAARRAVGKLKNAIYLHRAAEARAGRAWQTATQKGDTQAAVQAKKDQLLNNQAVRALLDAQAEVRAAIEFFRKVTKGNNEKLVKGGRDPDVVNAMRAILGVYGIAPRTGKGAMEYLELVQKNDPAMYAVIAPGVNTALANAKPFSELTVEEVRGLTDELKSLWHLAKRSRQMEIDGDLLDLEDLADQIYARMEDIGIPDVLPGEKGALTDAEIRKRNWLQQAPAILRRVEQWAEAKDGAFGGPFLRFIFQPVKIAADRYRADRLVYRRKFQALVDAIEPTMAKTLIAAPELDYTFGRGHNGIGMAEVLHAILHTGNDSNKRKLLLGREWATENPDGTLDTSRWDAFIARLITEGTLTKAHYDFAQGVWDLMEETKPLAQKTHRDVFGRYFAEVTANEVQTPFGTYRGGYVPAQADPLLVQDADQRELLETENAGMSYAFPATNKGFTKGRVEYNRPLKLDLRTLPQHIDKVLLFSHMEPAVRGVDRLLRRKKIAQALNKIDPAAINGMLKPWLNRSARQTVETPVSYDAGLNRKLSQARARTGMALMMANVSNTLQQITGFSTALLKVKGSHMRRAVAQYIADPQQLKNTVWSLSPYMADRASNEVAVLSDTLEAILLNPSVYESAERFTRRHAYFLQTGMDNQMSPIIWTGAYNQALVEGMNDRMARRFADGVIRQTQGSTLPEDVSRVETGTAFVRAFTQFVGYFNMLANTNATAIQQIAQEQGLRKGAGKAFGVLMVGMMIPIWVAEVIAHAMRGGPEDEDDDGYLDDWLAAVFGFGTIRGILSGIPGIAQIGQKMVNGFNDNPADDRFSLSPTVSVLESAVAAPQNVYKAIVDEGSAQKAVRDMSALITLATGLPAMTLARPLGYAAGVAQGKIEPTGPVDAARGLVTGTASPESKNP